MFVSFWMTQRLTAEKNRLEMEVLKKTMELSRYQRYAGRLGGSGSFGVSQIAGLSPELAFRGSLFGQYADQARSMSAMQMLQQMKAMGRIPYTGNPQLQMQIEMSAYNQFRQQAMTKLKEQEVAVLNEKEKEIELDLNSLKQQLAMKEKLLEVYKNKALKEAADAAPQYS